MVTPKRYRQKQNCMPYGNNLDIYFLHGRPDYDYEENEIGTIGLLQWRHAERRHL